MKVRPGGWYLIVLLACGCDQLFNIDAFQHVDAATIDDGFQTTMNCLPWGSAYLSGPNAQISEGNGMLRLRPGTQAQSIAACNGDNVMLGDGGFVVDVADVVQDNPGEYTNLAIFASSEGPAIGVHNGMLRFGSTNGVMTYVGEIAYDPVTMHWWRLTPATNRTELVAWYSGDGIAWSRFGMHSIVLPATVSMSISAQLGGSDTFTHEGEFRRFVSCP